MYISKLYISAYFCIYIQVKIIVKKKLENEEHLFKTRFWFYRSIGDIYILYQLGLSFYHIKISRRQMSNG